MRDSRCNEKFIREDINSLRDSIKSYKDSLQHFEGHDFYRVYASIINMKFYILKNEYMLGNDLNQLREEYLEIISDLKKIDYLVHSDNIVDILSLAILFEDSIENIKTIVKLGDISKKNDIVFDYLANGCGIKREFNSKYFRDDDNKVLTEIIKLSKVDNKKASERFTNYIENEFPENYSEEDLTGDVGEKFLGVCLFSYSAIAKILNLDDSLLENNPYYAYDLVHYKNEMKFFPEETGDMFKNYKKGISECRELEKVVPVQFHEEANRIFLDHKNLSDEEFYEKYNIHHITKGFDLERYIERKNEPYLLGFLVFSTLGNRGYLLGIDDPEEIEEYMVYDFWEDIGDIDVKAVNFNLGNGSYLLGYIPKNVELKYILDVKIENVRHLREFDDYAEHFKEEKIIINLFCVKIKVKKSIFNFFKKKPIDRKHLFSILKDLGLKFGGHNAFKIFDETKTEEVLVVYNSEKIGRGILLDYDEENSEDGIVLAFKLPNTPTEIKTAFDIVRKIKSKYKNIEIYVKNEIIGEFCKQSEDEFFSSINSVINTSLNSLKEECTDKSKLNLFQTLALFPYEFPEEQRAHFANANNLEEYEDLLHNLQKDEHYFVEPEFLKVDGEDSICALYYLKDDCESIFPIRYDGFFRDRSDSDSIKLKYGFIKFVFGEEIKEEYGPYAYEDFIEYVLNNGAKYFGTDRVVVKMSKDEMIKMSESLKISWFKNLMTTLLSKQK